MALRIKSSHVIALAITAAIGGWMATGSIVFGGQSADDEHAPPIAEREAVRSGEPFKVSYVAVAPRERMETVLVRGRTKADAIVAIRAETAGILEKRLVNKGDRVKEGDLVCIVERGVREERVTRAEALLAQAEADHESNRQLREKGYATENKLNQMKAALDAARASLAEARWDLNRTEVRANAAGIVQDPIAEPGDMLSAGGSCVTLIDTDPMLFTGQVSERDIGRIVTGMTAQVTPVTGAPLQGTVRYIAPSADAQTRTFLVEIALDDAAGAVRDGVTASAVIALPATPGYLLSPSWLTLSDDGRIGVRVVGAADEVAFAPVRIVAQSGDGFWVEGLEPGMRVITLGQEYVSEGEKVVAVPDPVVKAELTDDRG